MVMPAKKARQVTQAAKPKPANIVKDFVETNQPIQALPLDIIPQSYRLAIRKFRRESIAEFGKAPNIQLVRRTDEQSNEYYLLNLEVKR